MNATAAIPVTCLITSGEATPENFDLIKKKILANVRLAVECGVSIVQIREKRLTAKLLFELTSEAADVTDGSVTKLLVNDRADVAAAAGADGVHLTSDSIPLKVVRESFGPGFMIGRSVHSAEEAATSAGADFLLFAPVFATPGKGAPAGLAALTEVCRLADPIPVLALGGIDESNFRSVLDAGAAGFAAIRSFNEPDELRRMMKNFQKDSY